jgi:hypothetical protein
MNLFRKSLANTMSCVIRWLPYIIRERAFRHFEARGGQPGHELDDWLQAAARDQASLWPLK